jgi:hypothetical protein
MNQTQQENKQRQITQMAIHLIQELGFNTGLKLRKFREIVLLATSNDAMQFNTEHDLSFFKERVGKTRKKQKKIAANRLTLFGFIMATCFFSEKNYLFQTPFW